ncbi:MAG: calcium-binding protein, partial [Methylococcaceae bacterium]
NSNNSYLVEVTASDNNNGTDTQSLTVNINNLAAVVINPSTTQTTGENGSNATYSIVLNDAPASDVVLNFSSSDTSEATVTPSLTFASSNWNTAQTLVVHGVDDYLNDGNVAYSVAVSVSTTDLQYKNLNINPLQLTNLDDGRDVPLNLDGDRGNTKAIYDTLIGLDGNDTLHGYTMSDSLSGGIGGDKLWGGYGNDTLDGGVGHDLLNGEAGADLINGGSGDDTLDGGAGIDILDGGAGNDVYIVDECDLINTIKDSGASSDKDTVLLDYAQNNYALPSSIENGIIITDSNCNCNNHNNITSDTLTGNASNNILTGNEGNNALNGYLGNDTLIGNAGNDTLNGGLGGDILTGGAGQDIFNFTDVLNSSNIDTLTDFVPVDDTIQLNHSIFSALTATGVLNTAYLKIGAVAGDNNDYIIYNPNTGVLSYDADANSSKIAAIPIALLGTHLAITNADFVVN